MSESFELLAHRVRNLEVELEEQREERKKSERRLRASISDALHRLQEATNRALVHVAGARRLR